MIVVGFLLSVLLIADLNASGLISRIYQNSTFSANHVESSELILAASGICPQNRKTQMVSDLYLSKKSPFLPSSESTKTGKRLYKKDAKPIACQLCHGIMGDGNGRFAVNMEPPPRNFTCSRIMRTLPDGQLFWIIKNGSKGTKMPAHKSTLSDKQIWQLIHYLRKFAD